MNGKVVFLIPFLLDQDVILLRQSLLMDQVPVFLPMEPRLAPYGRPLLRGHAVQQQQQQTYKVWQPQRAARSKRPNTPSDGSKHNGFQTTNQAVLIPKHVSKQDRAHDQEYHPLLHRLVQWHGKQ